MTATATALRLNGAARIDPLASDEALTSNLAVEQVELPEPRAGEVVVEPLFTGICGSDSSAAIGKANFDWVERPRTIGHEFTARVVDFGPETEGYGGLQKGDVVAALAMLGCRDPRCPACRRGRWNYCRRRQIFGFHRDGGMATRTVIEADRCLRLRPGITPLQGAVIEPLSVVAQGVLRKCNIQPGMDVVVSGCGIIGLMAAELSRAAGGRVAVVGVERDRDVRLKLAAERGFLPIVVDADNPLHEQLMRGMDHPLGGTRFGDDYNDGLCDVLIEASGAPSALGTAGLSVQPEGHVCVLATYPTEVAFGATAFTRSGQTMQGVMGSSHEDYDNAQKLLQHGMFPVEDYTTIYPFDDVISAMSDSIRARTPKALLQINR